MEIYYEPYGRIQVLSNNFEDTNNFLLQSPRKLDRRRVSFDKVQRRYEAAKGEGPKNGGAWGEAFLGNLHAKASLFTLSSREAGRNRTNKWMFCRINMYHLSRLVMNATAATDTHSHNHSWLFSSPLRFRECKQWPWRSACANKHPAPLRPDLQTQGQV